MRLQITIPSVLLLLAMILVGSTRLDAQSRNRKDHRGRDFWVAYLQTNGAERAPRLAATISAERVPTRVTFTYARDGSSFDVIITEANTAYHINLDTDELMLPSPRVAPLTNSALYVHANDEITLYGINTMVWSSDAFLALPTDQLGTRHVILSYPNTISADLQGEFTGASDFPSQFAIVAGENGTEVDVYPTVRINGRRDNSPFHISMQAGDVFFAQADGKAGVDITGTEIRTNRPVTVYGSHQRTNIPWTAAVGRDHLVEQLPSVDRWPYRVMVTPHFQIPKTKADPNIFRIIAANDNTVISLDSTEYGTLNARQVLELPLDRAHLVTASGPILVAQYQASVSDQPYVRVPNDSIGDPFMSLVTAPEQFDTLYAFESFSSPEFFFHYINVTVPTERIPTLRLDGQPVGVPFTRIEKTSYSYAQIQVSGGSHMIRADVPFGLMIYGYGPYNSYGYPGGLVFDTLYKDQRRPDIGWYDVCGGAAGAATDAKFADMGMDTLRLLPSSRNVKLTLTPYRRGDDSIPFRLDLIDPYQDGWADLVAVDSVGLDRYYSFPVKGFTLSIAGGGSTPVRLDTLASLNGKEFCRQITVTNYGGFPQDLTTLLTDPSDADLRVSSGLPATLRPGETRTIDICYRHAGDTSALYTIKIGNDCLLRPVAELPVISGVDTSRPKITPSLDPCRSDESLDLTDVGVLNAGVDSVIVTTLVNADTVFSSALPSKEVGLTIRRIDPYKDMIYSLIVKDAVGNLSTISDTIGGFTLAATRRSGQPVGARFDAPWKFQTLTYGDLQCDTILLHNYGLLPLDLTSLHLEGNAQFSIPPEQLPIHLEVGETRPLAVCLVPRRIGDQSDTLVAEFFCGALTERIPLNTMVDPLYQTSRDGCGSMIVFDIGGFLRRSFIQAPVPNPVEGGSASITVGLAESGPTSLVLYDGKGNEVRRIIDEPLVPAGLAKVDADVRDLPSGVYYLRLVTPSGTPLTEKLVINH